MHQHTEYCRHMLFSADHESSAILWRLRRSATHVHCRLRRRDCFASCTRQHHRLRCGYFSHFMLCKINL